MNYIYKVCIYREQGKPFDSTSIYSNMLIRTDQMSGPNYETVYSRIVNAIKPECGYSFTLEEIHSFNNLKTPCEIHMYDELHYTNVIKRYN